MGADGEEVRPPNGRTLGTGVTLAEFFIGALDGVLEVAILTRGVGRYRTYFSEV